LSSTSTHYIFLRSICTVELPKRTHQKENMLFDPHHFGPSISFLEQVSNNGSLGDWDYYASMPTIRE